MAESGQFHRERLRLGMAIAEEKQQHILPMTLLQRSQPVCLPHPSKET